MQSKFVDRDQRFKYYTTLPWRVMLLAFNLCCTFIL